MLTGFMLRWVGLRQVKFLWEEHTEYKRLAGQSGDRIPVGARFSAPVKTGPGANPASCKMGTESFPGVKSGWGVTLTPHPLIVPLVIKE